MNEPEYSVTITVAGGKMNLRIDGLPSDWDKEDVRLLMERILEKALEMASDVPITIAQ